MSVEIIEGVTSREYSTSATRSEGTWRYTARVLGEADPEIALNAAILADAPFYWLGMSRRELKAAPAGGGLYTVEVPYLWEFENAAAQDPTASPGPTDGPGGGSPSGAPTLTPAADARLGPNWSLEIGGRPPKLMRSWDVVYSERAGGGAAPDNMGLLNVEDGKPQGQEIDDPATVLTIDVQYDYITVAFINRLTAMVWKTNADDWYFIPSEGAAFLGCTLQSTDSGRVKGTLRLGLRPELLVEENELRADAGSELPTADVTLKGWELLEIDYGDEFDTPSGVNAKRPTAMRVHKVLKTADFTDFGLGG